MGMGACPMCGDLGLLPGGWLPEETINGRTYPAGYAYGGACSCDAGDEHYAGMTYTATRLLFGDTPLEALAEVKEGLEVRWKIIHDGIHPALIPLRKRTKKLLLEGAG